MRRLMIILATSLITSLSWLSTTAMAQRIMAVPPGLYEIEVVATGKVLDLKLEDMRTVQQWNRGGGNNQRWHIENAGGGNYTIRSAENSAYLGVAETRDGGRVMAMRRGNRGDLWRFESLGNGEVLIVHSSGLTLDIPGGNVNNGIPLQVWSAARNNNQRFRLAPVGGAISGRYPDDPNDRDRRYDPNDRDRRYDPNDRDRRSIYNEGRRAGVRDYQNDLSRNYRRYRQDYDLRTERVFSEGYNAGYDEARFGQVRNTDTLNRMNVVEQRYYNDGYRLGQQDARYGNNSDYRRYIDRFNRRFEPFFQRGYEDGYNRYRF